MKPDGYHKTANAARRANRVLSTIEKGFKAASKTKIGRSLLSRTGANLPRSAGSLAKWAKGFSFLAGPAISLCLDYLESDFVKYAKRIKGGQAELNRRELQFSLELARAKDFVERAQKGMAPALGWGSRANLPALERARARYEKSLSAMCDALGNMVRRHDEMKTIYQELDRSWHSLNSPAMKRSFVELEAQLKAMGRG